MIFNKIKSLLFNYKIINNKKISRIDKNIIKIEGKNIEYVANILDYKDLKAEEIPNGLEIIKDRDLILDYFYDFIPRKPLPLW